MNDICGKNELARRCAGGFAASGAYGTAPRLRAEALVSQKNCRSPSAASTQCAAASLGVRLGLVELLKPQSQLFQFGSVCVDLRLFLLDESL